MCNYASSCIPSQCKLCFFVILFVDWERAVDSHGRVYFIDHNSKTTTWHRPNKNNGKLSIIYM